MLSFKQYVLEAMKYIPGQGNVFVSDEPAPFKRETPLPLGLQAIQRKDARQSAALAALPLSPAPKEPLSSTVVPTADQIRSARKDIKMAALRSAREKETSVQNTAIGSGFLFNLIGNTPSQERVETTDETGKVTTTVQDVPGSGILGALSNYDKIRDELGVSYRTTPTLTGSVTQLGTNIASSNSPLLGGIGATVRSTIGVKNAISSGLLKMQKKIEPKPVEPIKPMSPEELARATLRQNLEKGAAAQTAGLNTRSLDMETPEQIRQRMAQK